MAKAIIDFNRVYHSKFDGDYIIIKEVDSNIKGSREVIIKWLNTENIQRAPLQNALHESIRDKSKRSIDYNKIYNSKNFGDFKILSRASNSDSNHIMVNIQFIKTKTITTVRYCDALSGNVRDNYMPHVAGVGFKGNESSYHPAYSIWVDMLNRCYNKNDNNYSRYGAKGVTVSDRWKCFEYFAKDIKLLDGYYDWYNNNGNYHLDKDLKQLNVPINKKIYSVETCCFIPNYENSRISNYEYCNSNNTSSKFLGVRKLKNNKFLASIDINNVRYNIGIFETEEEAAYAYNIECIKNNRLVLNKLNMLKIIDSN